MCQTINHSESKIITEANDPKRPKRKCDGNCKNAKTCKAVLEPKIMAEVNKLFS